MPHAIDKLVIVTKQTAVEELVERFNTRAQACFYIEQMAGRGRFQGYEEGDQAYQEAVATLNAALPRGVRTQWIERAFLPNFTFGESDVVVTLGPDGLVVNTAKYLNGQPLVALNPDPSRVDGILLPFVVGQAHTALEMLQAGTNDIVPVTMAKTVLNDGQTLHAVNDLFIGQKTHVSARYRIEQDRAGEDQSSSGIIVSTGAGSTGWYRSVVTGASGVIQDYCNAKDVRAAKAKYRFSWTARHLVFSVREPFVSRTSSAEIVHGRITADEPLTIISQMPQNGVVFSDGVEEDFLAFNSGATATITLSEKTLNLVTPPQMNAHGRMGPWHSRHRQPAR
jgi:NAD kinase